MQYFEEASNYSDDYSWLLIIVGIFMLFCVGKIIRKAGYHWAWVFIWFVPVVNIIMLGVFAFKKWPTERAAAAWYEHYLINIAPKIQKAILEEGEAPNDQ